MEVCQVKVISAGTEGEFLQLLFISVTLYEEFIFSLWVDTASFSALCRWKTSHGRAKKKKTKLWERLEGQ